MGLQVLRNNVYANIRNLNLQVISPLSWGSQRAITISPHLTLALRGSTPLVPPRLTQVYQFKKCHEKAFEQNGWYLLREWGCVFFTDMWFVVSDGICVPHCERMICWYLLGWYAHRGSAMCNHFRGSRYIIDNRKISDVHREYLT